MNDSQELDISSIYPTSAVLFDYDAHSLPFLSTPSWTGPLIPEIFPANLSIQSRPGRSAATHFVTETEYANPVLTSLLDRSFAPSESTEITKPKTSTEIPVQNNLSGLHTQASGHDNELLQQSPRNSGTGNTLQRAQTNQDAQLPCINLSLPSIRKHGLRASLTTSALPSQELASLNPSHPLLRPKFSPVASSPQPAEKSTHESSRRLHSVSGSPLRSMAGVAVPQAVFKDAEMTPIPHNADAVPETLSLSSISQALDMHLAVLWDDGDTSVSLSQTVPHASDEGTTNDHKGIATGMKLNVKTIENSREDNFGRILDGASRTPVETPMDPGEARTFRPLVDPSAQLESQRAHATTATTTGGLGEGASTRSSESLGEPEEGPDPLQRELDVSRSSSVGSLLDRILLNLAPAEAQSPLPPMRNRSSLVDESTSLRDKSVNRNDVTPSNEDITDRPIASTSASTSALDISFSSSAPPDDATRYLHAQLALLQASLRKEEILSAQREAEMRALRVQHTKLERRHQALKQEHKCSREQLSFLAIGYDKLCESILAQRQPGNTLPNTLSNILSSSHFTPPSSSDLLQSPPPTPSDLTPEVFREKLLEAVLQLPSLDRLRGSVLHVALERLAEVENRSRAAVEAQKAAAAEQQRVRVSLEAETAALRAELRRQTDKHATLVLASSAKIRQLKEDLESTSQRCEQLEDTLRSEKSARQAAEANEAKACEHQEALSAELGKNQNALEEKSQLLRFAEEAIGVLKTEVAERDKALAVQANTLLQQANTIKALTSGVSGSPSAHPSIRGKGSALEQKLAGVESSAAHDSVAPVSASGSASAPVSVFHDTSLSKSVLMDDPNTSSSNLSTTPLYVTDHYPVGYEDTPPLSIRQAVANTTSNTASDSATNKSSEAVPITASDKAPSSREENTRDATSDSPQATISAHRLAELEDSQLEVSILRARLQLATNVLDTSSTNLNQLQTEVAELRQQLLEAQKENEELKEQLKGALNDQMHAQVNVDEAVIATQLTEAIETRDHYHAEVMRLERDYSKLLEKYKEAVQVSEEASRLLSNSGLADPSDSVVETLQSQLDEKHELLTATERKLSLVQGELDELNTLLAAKTESLAQALEKQESLEKELERNEIDAQAEADAKKKSEEQLRFLEQKCVDLEEELAVAMEKLSAASLNSDPPPVSQEHHQTVVDDFQTQLRTLQADLNTLQTKEKSLVEQLFEADSMLDAVEKELDAGVAREEVLKAQLDAVEAEKEALLVQLQQLQSSSTPSDSPSIESVGSPESPHSAEIASLHTQLSALEAEIVSLTNIKLNHENDNLALRQQVESLQVSVTRLKSESEAGALRVRELSLQVEALTVALETAKETAALHEARAKHLEQEKDDSNAIRAELDLLRTQKEDFFAENQKLSATELELRQQLFELLESLHKIEQSLKKLLPSEYLPPPMAPAASIASTVQQIYVYIRTLRGENSRYQTRLHEALSQLEELSEEHYESLQLLLTMSEKVLSSQNEAEQAHTGQVEEGTGTGSRKLVLEMEDKKGNGILNVSTQSVASVLSTAKSVIKLLEEKGAPTAQAQVHNSPPPVPTHPHLHAAAPSSSAPKPPQIHTSPTHPAPLQPTARTPIAPATTADAPAAGRMIPSPAGRTFRRPSDASVASAASTAAPTHAAVTSTTSATVATSERLYVSPDQPFRASKMQSPVPNHLHGATVNDGRASTSVPSSSSGQLKLNATGKESSSMDLSALRPVELLSKLDSSDVKKHTGRAREVENRKTHERDRYERVAQANGNPWQANQSEDILPSMNNSTESNSSFDSTWWNSLLFDSNSPHDVFQNLSLLSKSTSHQSTINQSAATHFSVHPNRTPPGTPPSQHRTGPDRNDFATPGSACSPGSTISHASHTSHVSRMSFRARRRPVQLAPGTTVYAAESGGGWSKPPGKDTRQEKQQEKETLRSSHGQVQLRQAQGGNASSKPGFFFTRPMDGETDITTVSIPQVVRTNILPGDNKATVQAPNSIAAGNGNLRESSGPSETGKIYKPVRITSDMLFQTKE